MTGSDLYLQKWKMHESVLDVLIGGQSSLDLKNGLRGKFEDRENIDRYVDAYGFDLEDPIEFAELQGTIQEALMFIRQYFLKPDSPDGLALEIPRAISDCRDIRQLLHYSSAESNPLIRNWSCSVLRIIHIISHIDRDMRSHYFPDIQKQIFDRFYRHAHRDENGKLYLGRNPQDPFRVDLVDFQTKPKKARESIILKLVHKPQNVAEELFDRVGIRFITHSRVDAVRVVHFLERTHSVVAANIRPSRSRNTLIDMDEFKRVMNQAVDVRDPLIEEKLSKIPFPPATDADNRFSSEFYRAIQFTGRQLIKLRNPLGEQLRELQSTAKGLDLQLPIQQAIDKMDPKSVVRTIRFFYPFEVQVMDDASYQENELGRSAHVEYKKAQIKAAQQRILGPLVPS